jgi:hypothetical protein
MTAHFVKFNQPRGFDALRGETHGFTEIVFANRVPSIRPGDRLVIYNVADCHIPTVVTVTGPVYRRTRGENLERWPFAVPAEPGQISTRGPKFAFAPPGQANPRRIDDELLAKCERYVLLNRG